MNTSAEIATDASAVLREGWQALVARLGIQKATQFIVLIEQGKGDSVKEIADYWGDASIEEIFQKVNDWKKAQQ